MTEQTNLEIVPEEKPERPVGVVEKTETRFKFYPPEVVKHDDIEIDYFHFADPPAHKSKKYGVVIAQEMTIDHWLKLVRSSLLRVVKTDGKEIPSPLIKDVLENLPSKYIFAMGTEASHFFVMEVD